ncbi:uncharacterized protein LOC114251471 [Bombyx mandarina]|uniref:Uncharacterized protein n=2 Tax=Bombyx TaxID=7090 RepID=A0A8R2HQK6_BOMMO|nr:uncharacterized protein LOC110385433 [Bombyx mori]XP_021204511.1 uncharacterized protein LOC110385433 [Bombyx mori]XP_021204512.1 uncharacterized protein LOC110385433 [Bombyx mori]XP_028041561.1 uncharacterized protein LOC114251471 [Bombyx mandarina]XP_037876095.1 uncharacterized protein LOC110385433 [Bombyx mori]
MLLRILIYFCLSFTVVFARGGFGGRSGGSHSYPHSTGYSGASRGGAHTYPHSTGYSGVSRGGTHTYPHSNSISGHSESRNVHNTYTQQHNVNYGHRTEIHNHYHYNPPQQVMYGSTYHPVYHGTPPTYIYEYRNSGSRFDTLLTGLALYNLGKMSGRQEHYGGYREYTTRPGEICKLRVEKRSWDYEETRIDCKLMSSFIWEAETTSQNQQASNKVTTVVETVASSSGTRNADGTISNTNITKTVTVTDALQSRGPSIQVMPGMQCYMIRISRDTSVLQKHVDCALLQTYANSMHYNRASCLLNSTVIFVIILHCLIK